MASANLVFSFGGRHKIIDFVLSNLAAAGIGDTVLGPPDEPHLISHLQTIGQMSFWNRPVVMNP